MVLIAVAGGTSPTLGRAIVSAINGETNNNAIILSSRPSEGTKYGCEVCTADYGSIPSLVNALSGVHTVISVLKIVGPHAVEYETNLLHAAKAAGVRRFAPAAFENGPLATVRVTILAMNKPAVWQACLDSGLEVARFSGGMFMNYLALGSGIDDATQGLFDEPIIWDVSAGKVEMPVREDGTAPKLTMTSLRDIGRFVAAACEMSEGRWEGSMQMVGQVVAVDEVTQIIEEVTGRRMEVMTVRADELRRRVEGIEGFGRTRATIFQKMVSEINLLVLEEKADMCVLKPVVNEMCPQIKPMSVREMVQLAWG